MDRASWLVLCALVMEREHGTRAAIQFMARHFLTEPNLVAGPSAEWWAHKYADHVMHWLHEEGRVTTIRRPRIFGANR